MGAVRIITHGTSLPPTEQMRSTLLDVQSTASYPTRSTLAGGVRLVGRAFPAAGFWHVDP